MLRLCLHIIAQESKASASKRCRARTAARATIINIVVIIVIRRWSWQRPSRYICWFVVATMIERLFSKHVCFVPFLQSQWRTWFAGIVVVELLHLGRAIPEVGSWVPGLVSAAFSVRPARPMPFNSAR